MQRLRLHPVVAAGLALAALTVALHRVLAEPRLSRLPAEAGWSDGSFLFVYHPDDCIGHRWIIERLNEAHARGLDVRGIPVRTPEGRAPAGGEVAARPKFPDAPALVDPVTRLMLRLGYRRTPVLLAFDEFGRVRHIVDLGEPAIVTRRALIRTLRLLSNAEEWP